MVAKERRLDSTVLDRLQNALAHRGPDSAGRFLNGAVGLVSTRLAIIDLKTGNQPFEGPDGTVLVANGEIYNDLDIRRELAQAPYKSGSDCESPLHLYRRKGLHYAHDLRGMYAIAIYDKPNSSLVLTRDPFGIKQLYYVCTPNHFAFASEPKALIGSGLAPSGIDPQKRSELLQLKFVTGAETAFSSIRRVLPGETLVIKDCRIIERRRRRIIPRDQPSFSKSHSEALCELDTILSESVRAHVRSDVPYGLFLSGGIDSSVLLALMSRFSAQPVKALTAVFPGSRAASEGEAASRAAVAVGAEHDMIEVAQEDFWNSTPLVAAALDDPTADAAALPAFKLARIAREKGIKVVLSGEGADEVFGGYSRYRRARWLWGLLSRKSRTRGVFDRRHSSGAFEGWRSGLEQTEKEEDNPRWSAMQRLQAVDCSEWLPNDLLIKLDRCLMAHGVEGRTPFLDSAVAPFAFGLPDALKVKGKLGKWLLREWLSNGLPEAEAFARKAGFNPPVGEWIERHKTSLEKLVATQPGIAEMSIKDIVRAAFAEPVRKSQAAWNLVFYALWHSHHILGVPADGSIGDVLSTAAKRG